MSNIYPFYSQDDRYEEASRWIARLDRGLSADEERKLKLWMQADDENRQLLFKMAELWDRMSLLSRLSDLFPDPQEKRHPSRSWPVAIAASLLIAVAAGLVFILPVEIPREPAQVVAMHNGNYETSIGEQSTVTLPDGTDVTLNTNSRLRVNYSADYRIFVLEQGEIHIRVARDTDRPLRVYAEDKIVQAVGTAFNVKINANKNVKLIVTDGKVLVADRTSRETEPARIRPTDITDRSIAVSKGEAVILGDKTETVQKIAESDIEATLSWRQGNIIFRGEPLSDAVAEISRYTDVKFEFTDEHIGDIRIAGLFKAGDVNGLLTTLNRNFDIQYVRIGENKVLLSYADF